MCFRIALIVLAMLPLAGQGFTVIMEPQPLKVTERVIGSREFGVWLYSITTQSSAPQRISRTQITAATPVNELTAAMSADVMRRAAAGNGWTIAGKGWDAVAPIASDVMLGFGFAEGSSALKAAAWTIKGLSLTRNLLRGVKAPNPEDAIKQLLDDEIACVDGSCGEFYVVTGLIPAADRIGVIVNGPEVLVFPMDRKSLIDRTERIMKAREAGIIQ